MIYLFVLLLSIISFPKLCIHIGLYQQNHYHIRRYVNNLKKHYFKTISTYLEYVTLLLMIWYSLGKEWYIITMAIFFLVGSFLLTEELIVIPKLTKRVGRLLVCLAVLASIPYLFLGNHGLCFLIQCIFLPFMLIISSIVNYPVESLINHYYKQKASKELTKRNSLVIGITGSYGKTSTKNIVHHLIKREYLVSKSPASFNTEAGICKYINNNLPELCDVVVLEFGATKPKDIEILTKLTKPQIGIITDIGPQHLESFKTIENVLKTKMELLMSPNLKVLVVNKDNQYLSSYSYPNNIKVVTIGIESDAHYVAKNIQLFNNKIVFDVYKQGEFYFNASTNLLAKHNIYNILSSIVVAEQLKIKKEKIVKEIESLNAVGHRLELKKEQNTTIIDDSFNCNVVGFQNALDVLALCPKPQIIITPGIVDAGKRIKELNEIVAQKMVFLDKVYLINNEASIHIEKKFQELDFKNYEVVKRFDTAYHQALKEALRGTILIENDLPDSYLRR